MEIPQGLPVATIIFILFTSPLFEQFSLISKETGEIICGYVYDGLLISRAKREKPIVIKIISTFQKVEQ